MFITKAKRIANWENLVVLFAIALPLGRGLFNISFALMILYWLSKIFKGEVNFGKKDFFFITIVSSYYLYAIVSLLYTDNIEYGLDKIYSQSFLFLFPLVFVSLRKEMLDKTFVRAFKGFLLSLTVVSILSLAKQMYQILFSDSGFELLTQNNLSTSVVDNYFLGFSLLISFGLITYTYMKLFKADILFFKIRFIELGIVFTLATTLLLLNSRNLIFIAALGACIVIFVKCIKEKRPRLFIKLFSIIVAVFCINYWTNPYFGDKMEKVVNYGQESSKDRYWGGMRASIWDCAIKVIKDDPVFGVGVGDQKDQLELCYKIYMHNRLFANNRSFNAHNIFLQILLSSGFIGVVMLLLSLGYMLRLAMLSNNMYYVLFAGVFVLAGLTESYFERNLTMAFFSFFNCLSFFSKSNLAT